MKLNNENYFSLEMQKKYMGVSQFKQFMKCEAAAMAELRGEYVPQKTTALLVGSFVDSYFEGTLAEFIKSHPEIVNHRTGELKADYKYAYDIIDRINSEPLFSEFMSGRKQVIKTGKFGGINWKIKIDSYFPKEKIVDLKVMRSLERIMGKSLVDHWHYDWQGAVYQEIEKGNLPFYLAIATKENPVNLEIAEIKQWNLDRAKEEILKYLPRIIQVKRGKVLPVSCGVCSYCVSRKHLIEPIDSDYIGYTNKEMEQILNN